MIINERELMAMREIEQLATELMADWPPTRNMQKAFVLAYVSNGFVNASKAIRDAGYSSNGANKTANNMLSGSDKYSHVKPVVEELRDIYHKRATELSIASGTEVLQYYSSLMRGEEKETELINVGDFKQEPIEVPVKHNVRKSAADSLAKYHGLMTDKLDISASGIEIVVGEWVDEDDD